MSPDAHPARTRDIVLRDVLAAIHDLRAEVHAGFTAQAQATEAIRLSVATLGGRLDSALDIVLERTGMRPVHLEPLPRANGNGRDSGDSAPASDEGEE